MPHKCSQCGKSDIQWAMRIPWVCLYCAEKMPSKIDRLRTGIEHLLLSRDVTWDAQGGHDFGEAVKEAQALLELEGDDGT